MVYCTTTIKLLYYHRITLCELCHEKHRIICYSKNIDFYLSTRVLSYELVCSQNMWSRQQWLMLPRISAATVGTSQAISYLSHELFLQSINHTSLQCCNLCIACMANVPYIFHQLKSPLDNCLAHLLSSA